MEEQADRAELASEEWQRDFVVTELRRSYPSGLAKGTLEERTGIGPGELRDVIAALEEEGAISEAEDADGLAGWRWLEPEERVIGPGTQEDPESDANPDGGEDPPEPLGGPETAAEAAPEGSERVSEAPYAAGVMLEVFFHPEAREGEAFDAAALREARMLAEIAAGAIVDRFPGLSPSVRTSVVAYDKPRPVG